MTGATGRWRRWPLGGAREATEAPGPGPDDDSADDLSFPFLVPSADAAHLEGDAVPRYRFSTPGATSARRAVAYGGAGRRPPGARLSGEGPRLVAATARSSNPAVVNATYGDTLTVFAEFDEPLRDLPVVHIAGCAARWRCDPSPLNRDGRKLGRGGGDDERSQNKILGVGHTTKTHVRRREGRRAQPDHIGVHRTLGRCPGPAVTPVPPQRVERGRRCPSSTTTETPIGLLERTTRGTRRTTKRRGCRRATCEGDERTTRSRASDADEAVSKVLSFLHRVS